MNLLTGGFNVVLGVINLYFYKQTGDVVSLGVAIFCMSTGTAVMLNKD